MTDEELMQLLRTAAAKRSEPCDLDPESMVDLIQGRLGEAEGRELLEEIVRRPACREEFELLRAVVGASGGVRSKPARRFAWPSPAAALPIAIAASVLLAVAGVIVSRDHRPDVTRAPAVEGAPVLIEPVADAQVSGPIQFRWQAVDGARGYRVELLTDAGTLVVSSQTSDTTASFISPAVTGSEPPYRWVVVAMLPEGREVASPPRRITVLAP